jgi:uncharacterized integral membrane protein
MATQPVVLDWPLALLFLLAAVVVIITAVFAGLTALAVLIGLTLPQARGEGLGPGVPPR